MTSRQYIINMIPSEFIANFHYALDELKLLKLDVF